MARTFFDSGSLNHRMRLLSPVEISDGCGGVDVTWTEAAQVWASLQPLSVATPDQAQQIEEQGRHKVFMRFRADVASGWRLNFADRVLEILTASDPDERKAYLVLTTQEDGR